MEDNTRHLECCLITFLALLVVCKNGWTPESCVWLWFMSRHIIGDEIPLSHSLCPCHHWYYHYKWPPASHWSIAPLTASDWPEDSSTQSVMSSLISPFVTHTHVSCSADIKPIFPIPISSLLTLLWSQYVKINKVSTLTAFRHLELKKSIYFEFTELTHSQDFYDQTRYAKRERKELSWTGVICILNAQ